MILKSFFRRISTKIYFIILFIAIFLICLLSLIINYLSITKEDAYSKRAFIYVESNIDLFDNLKSDKDLKKVRYAMLMKYADTLFDSHIIEYPQIGENTLVMVDDGEYSLKNNDIIINFNSLKDSFDDYKGKSILFNFNNHMVSLNIKDIFVNGGMSYIIISRDLYQELSSYKTINGYVANIKREEVQEFIASRYKNITMLLSESPEELEQRLKIEEYIKYLRFASYGIMLVFIIIIIIINKNIRADLSRSSMLEHKLGFTDSEVKLNFFKRIITLHLLVFILVFVIILSIIIIGNLVYKIPLAYTNIYLLVILLLIILLSDIMLSLFYK